MGKIENYSFWASALQNRLTANCNLTEKMGIFWYATIKWTYREKSRAGLIAQPALSAKLWWIALRPNPM